MKKKAKKEAKVQAKIGVDVPDIPQVDGSADVCVDAGIGGQMGKRHNGFKGTGGGSSLRK